jgi:hypothetical protein
MGSDSDLPVMQAAADALTELGVPFEMTIVSAHRTPKRLYDYAESAVGRGLKVIIAGAGGAAHLPGMAPRSRRCRSSACRSRPRRCPAGLVAVHRADAGRRAGGHRRHQRRQERRPAGGADPRDIHRGRIRLSKADRHTS